MRSYYAHLETAAPPPKIAVNPKPVLRSSAIFPVFQMPGVSSRILFMGYWLLKRRINEIMCVVTLRSEEGKILARSNMSIHESKAFSVELSDQLAAAGLDPSATFSGSMEIEFFSIVNLVFPYPAVVINYYGPHFSSVVHTAQRTYNDFEDMQRNSQTQVPESGFNIYVDDKREPFICLINGGEPSPMCKVKLDFYNSEHQVLSHEYDLGTMTPFQTKTLYPARDLPLKDFLKGYAGAAKASFNLKWVFPRLVVGNIQHNPPAITTTHSYYDCTKADSDADYWPPAPPEFYPASQILPVCVDGSHFTNVYFYPIYSPSTFHLDVEIYNSQGKLLGRKENVLTVTSPGIKFEKIDFKAICQELAIPPAPHLATRIIARPAEGSRLPSRIKMGLDIGEHVPQMPCNICNNLQPFVLSFEHKKSTFKWAPVLADQPLATTWILNSAPKVNFNVPAEVDISFHREQDEKMIERAVTIEPNGFLVISPQTDAELREFFGGRVGWIAVTSSNPYTNTYYFAENASGVIGGDHGF